MGKLKKALSLLILLVALCALLSGKDVKSVNAADKKIWTANTQEEFIIYVARGISKGEERIIVEGSENLLTGNWVPVAEKAVWKRIKSYDCTANFLIENIKTLTCLQESIGNGRKLYYVDVTYYETEKEYKQTKRILRKVVKRIKNKSDYEKVKYLTKWVSNYLEYDYETTENGSVYDAIRKHKGDCKSYALLFQRLAVLAGLDCRVVCGNAGFALHMWNAVRLNGKFYYLDVCFGDGDKDNLWFLFGDYVAKKYRVIDEHYKLKGVSNYNYPIKKKEQFF